MSLQESTPTDAASDFIIRLVDSEQDRSGARRIRSEVFYEEQGRQDGSETDEKESASASFLLSSKSNPSLLVGTIRFSIGSIRSSSQNLTSSSTFDLVELFLQHLILRNSLSAILDEGSGSFSQVEAPILQIQFSKLAISRPFRKKNLGRKLLTDCEEWFVKTLKERAEDQGLKFGRIEFRGFCRGEVVGFYESLGYESEKLNGNSIDSHSIHLVKKTIRF